MGNHEDRAKWAVIRQFQGEEHPPQNAVRFPDNLMVSMIFIKQCSVNELFDFLCIRYGQPKSHMHTYMFKSGYQHVTVNHWYTPDNDTHQGHRFQLEALENNHALYLEV